MKGRTTVRVVAIVLLLGTFGVDARGAEPGPADGAAIFKARCARCHGESGRADAPGARALKVRPLVDDATLARMTPADIAKRITSDPKHRALGSVSDLDDTALNTVAVFVRQLARERATHPRTDGR